MKIAQVCPYDYFRGGGVQSHIEFLADELRQLGHEVKIIAPDMQNGANKREDVILVGGGLKVTTSKTTAEVTALYPKDRNKLKDILNEEAFDIIHYQEPAMPMLPAQILMLSDVPSVGTFHAAPAGFVYRFPVSSLLKQMTKSILNALDKVIAVSTVPRNHLKQFSNKKVHIIPNGVDLKVFSPDVKPYQKYQDDKVNIFFMGRLDKRKGVMYLLKAYKRLKKNFQNVRLIIGGKGSEFEKIEKYIKRKKLKDVDLLGYVDEKDKPRFYASCDIFCSPATEGESFGIVLAEGMAHGKPVIGGNNPGYRSVLKGRGGLLVVNPKNIARFAEKLEILCKDRELRDFFGDWGLEEVKQYAWPTVAKQIETLYRNVLEDKKKVTDYKKVKQIKRSKMEKLVKALNQEVF